MEEAKNDKPDVVNKEDYNKVVETHNTVKAENELLRKELEELKKAKEQEEENSKVAAEETTKKEWEEQLKAQKEQLEALQKTLEEKDDKVSKGIVKQPDEIGAVKGNEFDETKKLLNEQIPDLGKNPKNLSNLNRYGYYQNPSTKTYSDEQFGMGLSLQASAYSQNPNIVPREAKMQQEDLVVKK